MPPSSARPGHRLEQADRRHLVDARRNGYWLVASDGGIFNFGDAAFSGSAASNGISNGVAVGTASST
jgi:hypothetical protein